MEGENLYQPPCSVPCSGRHEALVSAAPPLSSPTIDWVRVEVILPGLLRHHQNDDCNDGPSVRRRSAEDNRQRMLTRILTAINVVAGGSQFSPSDRAFPKVVVPECRKERVPWCHSAHSKMTDWIASAVAKALRGASSMDDLSPLTRRGSRATREVLWSYWLPGTQTSDDKLWWALSNRNSTVKFCPTYTPSPPTRCGNYIARMALPANTPQGRQSSASFRNRSCRSHPCSTQYHWTQTITTNPIKLNSIT